ncbi:glycerol-3-phosphate dehydrogenase C-terminal domain-containing protein, partial [Oleiphilus sp. HI0066]
NAVMAQLQRYVPNLQEEWTERHPLIGNSKLGMTRQGITDHLTSHYPWLTSSLVRRYASSYGLLAENFLTGRESINELGQDFSNGLYQAEVDYLIKEEWARNAKDILLRRTKLGYQFSDSQEKTLRTYIQSYLNEPNITHLNSA